MCDFKFAPFAGERRKPYKKDELEKDYGLFLQQALEPAIRFDNLVKAQIAIHVMVLENDGTSACVSMAINAASMALMDAGIEMFDLVMASSCVFQEELLLDATLEEEKQGNGSLIVSCMPSLNQVTHTAQVGQVPSATCIEVNPTHLGNGMVYRCMSQDTSSVA